MTMRAKIENNKTKAWQGQEDYDGSQRRMGRKLRNNFPSSRPKTMSKGPHQKNE